MCRLCQCRLGHRVGILGGIHPGRAGQALGGGRRQLAPHPLRAAAGQAPTLEAVQAAQAGVTAQESPPACIAQWKGV